MPTESLGQQERLPNNCDVDRSDDRVEKLEEALAENVGLLSCKMVGTVIINTKTRRRPHPEGTNGHNIVRFSRHLLCLDTFYGYIQFDLQIPEKQRQRSSEAIQPLQAYSPSF